jgi:hypothetical protein
MAPRIRHYASDIDPLAAEIRRQGMECRFVTYREIVKGPASLPPGSCAIVCGTYPTVCHAMLKLGWSPGGWCSPENLDREAYYSHFTEFLLNSHCEIITGVSAIRKKVRLVREYGATDACSPGRRVRNGARPDALRSGDSSSIRARHAGATLLDKV